MLFSGLCLTDESVAAAATAAKQLVHSKVTQQVAAVLQATPLELAHQHSGLTPLMRFACTAAYDDPTPPEVCRDRFQVKTTRHKSAGQSWGCVSRVQSSTVLVIQFAVQSTNGVFALVCCICCIAGNYVSASEVW
jgi:hypothetical protein